jgi:hypothetical protein
VLLTAASVAAQKTETQESLVRRYPFDPACPWGRIGNVKGMIVRCLAEAEARELLKRTTSGPGSIEASDPSRDGAGSGSESKGPDSSDSDPSAEEGGGDEGSLEVSVGPIVADQGELSLAKLAQPKARYQKCVLDHGGLKDRSGEVQVRFLVRSKGIAEGVSVQKRTNVSAEAARCIADIVDRRRVGVPEAPLVGAAVTVKFEKSVK